MARKELTFNFLGYKKVPGFKPIYELTKDDFHSPENPPPEISQRIANAFIEVLSKPQRPPTKKAE